jgi:hypothetical protein
MSAHNSAICAFLWSEGHGPGTRISNDLMHRIGADWERFREAAEALGFDATEHRAIAINPTEGDEWDYAAHDFILTRNHHGAGFWDGGWHARWGERLTALSHTFPELESYFDDDDILRLC